MLVYKHARTEAQKYRPQATHDVVNAVCLAVSSMASVVHFDSEQVHVSATFFETSLGEEINSFSVTLQLLPSLESLNSGPPYTIHNLDKDHPNKTVPQQNLNQNDQTCVLNEGVLTINLVHNGKFLGHLLLTTVMKAHLEKDVLLFVETVTKSLALSLANIRHTHESIQAEVNAVQARFAELGHVSIYCELEQLNRFRNFAPSDALIRKLGQ